MKKEEFEQSLIEFLGLQDRRICTLKIELGADLPVRIETTEWLDLDKVHKAIPKKYKLSEIEED